jgi:hypothetical protein
MPHGLNADSDVKISQTNIETCLPFLHYVRAYNTMNRINVIETLMEDGIPNQ